LSDDLRPAFESDDEASAAFTMFDKDLNGDISMEELEAVCVEIGRERKAITASLKDLDTVISKLDGVLMFIVAVIAMVVLVSIISTSASGVLTSLGSSLLALSWLFAATAQEFLQSIVFVFVKHPFDVGDRVTIYGNTGSEMKGDDYFVKEISLLYTEFKKMEGHVVQAPNSYLNTLFILNQRRSGGLAEAVPVTVKFGTTLDQIDTLRTRLLEFVTAEKREYQKNILTELRQIYEAHSITLNVIFFYKSNWQNELLRLQRRNKFICAMMVTMNEIGMEGPRMRYAGATEGFPVHLRNAYPYAPQPAGPDGYPPTDPYPSTYAHDFKPIPEEGSQFQPSSPSINKNPSILRKNDGSSRRRGESISAMGKRVDFSLGMSSVSMGDQFGDVFDDDKPRLPPTITPTSPTPGPGRISRDSRASEDNESLARTTSRESHAGSQRTHRNRFFSRGRSNWSKLGSADEGTNLDDLEAGTREINIRDMPDIPEASGGNSASWGAETHHQTIAAGNVRTHVDTNQRMDPRTGIVSPQAVARDSARERRELPMSSGAVNASRP
jgi:small-conductance mechanosensitive channel